MKKHEVCTVKSIDDENIVFTKGEETKYVVDVDTYMEKRDRELKVGDNAIIHIDGREENADGTYTPNVISIYYSEKDPKKIIFY